MEISDRASEILATSENEAGHYGAGMPTAFNTEAYSAGAHKLALEKVKVYLKE